LGLLTFKEKVEQMAAELQSVDTTSSVGTYMVFAYNIYILMVELFTISTK
jgi:hypothetical protein